MFNLDNFGLDFDDDFPTNIFNKCTKAESIRKGRSENEFNLNQGSHDDLHMDLDLSKKQTMIPEKLKHEVLQPEKLKNGLFKEILFNDSSSKNTCVKINKLKRPCEQDEKPQKKKLTHEGLVQRKFPGPAGLLPDRPLREVSDFTFFEKKIMSNEISKREKEEAVIFSQSSGSVFSKSPYQKLVLDFELSDPHNPLTKYTVEWVKKTAVNKSLNGRKIPFLAVTLHCINNSTPDPILMLRDMSGEISGTLHREVWAEMGGKLRSGIAIALKQVGVLISGIIRRKIYLNITMNNILSVYSQAENDDVEIYLVNRVTKADLLKNIEKWQKELSCHSPKSLLKSPAPSLFSSVVTLDQGIDSYNNEKINNFKNSQNFAKTSALNLKVEESEKRDVDENIADLDNLFSNSDFNEDINCPQKDFSCDLLEKKTTSEKGEIKSTGLGTSHNKPLSQSDSLIMEEVLKGINLDDFEF